MRINNKINGTLLATKVNSLSYNIKPIILVFDYILI